MNLALSRLPILAKIGLSSVLLVMVIGYVASLAHLKSHVGRKDDDPELTWTDIVGTYAGVERPSSLLVALDDPRHREKWATGLTPPEEKVLRDWLARGATVSGGGRDPVESGYDAHAPGMPEDALLPADILETRCVRCHATEATEGDGVGARIPLRRWPEVRKFAYAKTLNPISKEILTISTHTHALSLGIMAMAYVLLLAATRWPRGLTGFLGFALGFGLLLDFVGMWWARSWTPAAALVPVGGALFGFGFGLATLLLLLDLWRPAAKVGS
jgi:hypothetical protein